MTSFLKKIIPFTIICIALICLSKTVSYKIMPSRLYNLENTVLGLEKTNVYLLEYSANESPNYFPASSPNVKGATAADDQGLYLFVPYISKITGKDATQSIYIFFLLIISISLLISFFGTYLIYKNLVQRVIAAIVFSLLAIFASFIKDVYILYYFSISFVPLIYLIAKSKNYYLQIFGIALIGLILGYGNLIRGLSSTGVIISFLTLIILFKQNSWMKRIILILLLILSSSVNKIHLKLLVNKRDHYLSEVNDYHYVSQNQHAIWHNAYIGLGFIDNNFEIEYSDSCGLKHVKEVNYEVVYLSEEYFEILKAQYFKIIKSSPLFFLRNIFAKFGVIIMYVLLFANIGIFLRFQLKNYKNGFDFFFLGLFAYYSLFGIITVPYGTYCLGLISVSVLWSLNIILQKIAETKLVKKI